MEMVGESSLSHKKTGFPRVISLERTTISLWLSRMCPGSKRKVKVNSWYRIDSCLLPHLVIQLPSPFLSSSHPSFLFSLLPSFLYSFCSAVFLPSPPLLMRSVCYSLPLFLSHTDQYLHLKNFILRQGLANLLRCPGWTQTVAFLLPFCQSYLWDCRYVPHLLADSVFKYMY